MWGQNPVHRFHLPQHRCGQPLRPRPVGRGQPRQWSLRVNNRLTQQVPLVQYGPQQTNRRRPRCQTFCRHATNPCCFGLGAYINTSEGTRNPAVTTDPTPDLPPEAQRALAEAAERRRTAQPTDLPPELGGRNGPEPVRYGDWEKKGLAIDF
jgi:hypothetical protein